MTNERRNRRCLAVHTDMTTTTLQGATDAMSKGFGIGIKTRRFDYTFSILFDRRVFNSLNLVKHHQQSLFQQYTVHRTVLQHNTWIIEEDDNGVVHKIRLCHN